MMGAMNNLPNENELQIKTNPNTEDIALILSLLEVFPTAIKEILQGTHLRKLSIPPKEKEWSILQNLAHIRSCADVWGDTIVKMLNFDNPSIKYQSPRSWSRFEVYAKMDFWDSFQDYSSQRYQLLETLMYLEFKDWERKCSIKERTHTIYSQCRRMVTHELSHFNQIKKVIGNLT